MFGLGVGELVLLVLLLLLLFGAKRIPEIAKGLGSGIRTFKTEIKKPEEEEAPRELPRPEAREPEPRTEPHDSESPESEPRSLSEDRRGE